MHTMQPFTSSSSLPTSTVGFHSLPIQTDFEGTTDIRENFTSVMTRDAKDGLWHATLRGRSLVGQEVQLPPDYAVALVGVTEDTPASSPSPPLAFAAGGAAGQASGREPPVEVPCSMYVQAAAPSFTLWEHDMKPAGAATVPQWIALSAIIHSAE